MLEPEYSSQEITKGFQDSFAAAVQTIMAANGLISIVFAGALQFLWGLINSLQIIVLSVLFNLQIPENAKVIQVEILKACAFDFFQT